MSPAEARFERWRRTIGLFAGPSIAVIVWMIAMPGLSPDAHRLAAVVSLVVVWWVSEAIPIPATALIGAALTVVFGITTAQAAFAPFASPIIFLFIGSFMISRAVADHGLDRRLAASLLSLDFVRGNFGRMTLALMGLTLVMSGWMSNTATTAMMLPVALGVLSATGAGAGDDARRRGAPMLLGIAYAASIGGIATPVGSPPNLITIGLLDSVGGHHVTFFSWMIVAGPISLAVGLALAWITSRRLGSTAATLVSYVRPPDLGAGWTRGQWNCAVAFAAAVTFWILPGVVAVFWSSESAGYQLLSARAAEAVVAVLAAALLFVLPTDWSQRRFTLGWESASRIDWGTILLFGGGLSLGQLMFTTGLAAHIGAAMVQMSGAESLWTITAASIVIGVVMTEVVSNTAATNMMVPVVISICQATGVSPVPPAMGVALAASLAFMLPISTPPNAIVYGSGFVPITAMVRQGLVMDLVAGVIIFVGLRLLCPLAGLA